MSNFQINASLKQVPPLRRKKFISAAVLPRVNTAYMQWLAILNEPQKHFKGR